MDPHNFNSDSSDSSSSSSDNNEELYQQMYMHLVNNLLLDPADEEIPKIIQAWLDQRGESSSSQPRNTGPRHFVPQDRVVGNQRLIADYFSDSPVYNEDIFRRRFRMRRHLFLSIVQTLGERYSFFSQRVDATGLPGLSPLQKCTAAVRQLAYGGPADMFDEYIRIGESTSTECLKFFCHAIVTVYGERYLRRPTEEDLHRLHDMHLGRHGFPGMLGSVDCMHWQWRNYPNAWKGKFTRGDQGVPTIILEAVASVDLWIWYAFFGVAGSNNDINVLNQSNLFNDVPRGSAPALDFFVNGRHYHRGYYLADGIYPEWASFVKSYTFPMDQKRGYFKQRQESARKDVERVFGVLQARWAIVRGPARAWYRSDIKNIMLACVIMHNMIVEDEGDQASNWSGDQVEVPVQATQGVEEQYIHLMHRYRELRDCEAHHRLRADLVDHLWANRDLNDI